MSHISLRVQALVKAAETSGHRITPSEWAVAANSFERAAMVPHLDDDTLMALADQHRSNIAQTRIPPITYDENLAHTIVPVLQERLKQWREVAMGVYRLLPHPDEAKGVLTMFYEHDSPGKIRRFNRMICNLSPDQPPKQPK